MTAIAVRASNAAIITWPLLLSSRFVSTSDPVPRDSVDVDADVVGGWDDDGCEDDDEEWPGGGGNTLPLFGGGGVVAAVVVRGWVLVGVD